jgi:hypothetical protein
MRPTKSGPNPRAAGGPEEPFCAVFASLAMPNASPAASERGKLPLLSDRHMAGVGVMSGAGRARDRGLPEP